MAETNVVDTEYTIIENSSFNFNFRFVDVDDDAVAPSSQKVYVYVDGTDTYINSRDGDVSTGLTVTDTNLVNFNMSPADNAISDATAAASRGYETHRVLIEVNYNADADQYLREYILRIRYSPVTVS